MEQPNAHYTPFTRFDVTPANPREAPFGELSLSLVKGNSTHTIAFNREDLLTLADRIHAATGVRFVERDEVREALANVAEFFKQRDPMLGLDPNVIVGANHANLNIRDIRILMEAAEGAIQ